MNTVQQEFDTIMKGYGGIYLIQGDNNYDSLLDCSKKLITSFIQRTLNEDPHLPLVNIEYVENKTFNATAFKANTYHIGIFKGLVIELNHMFNEIVENEILYENGIYSKDKKDIYKEKFLQYSLKFLISHEFSHIIFGHCDYRNSINLNFIFEVVAKCNSRDSMLSQTLEFDADCTATSKIINRILIDNRENMIEEEISCFTFSIYCLFRLLSSEVDCYKNINLDELDRFTHPHLGIRQDYIYATVATVIGIVYGQQFCKYTLRKFGDNIMLAEQVYLNNKEINNLIDSLISIAYTKKGSNHQKRIHNNWQYVREELLRFSFAKLAPFEESKFERKTID